jgi:murein DD-endopeptidase MepM/ murein hydrolase activator NlpD
LGRYRGSAAIRRARTWGYAVRVGRGIAVASLVLASSASAQSTGGSTAEQPAPRLSAPPPGIKPKPAPLLSSWRCVRACPDRVTATAGSLVRIRGRALGRTYEVVFLGAAGAADDVAAAPLRRKRHVVDVRVPLAAASGPLVVAHHDGQQSAPSAVPLAVAAPLPATVAAAPTVEVQALARRAFFDGERPAAVSYVVHGDAPARVAVELVRLSDGAVVQRWEVGEVPPESPQKLSWDGTVGGKLQREGRYSFRVTAVRPDGVQAVSAQAGQQSPDPAAIHFLKHEFPVRGPHYFGEFAARFGGGRGHQGQDVFAACGTPLVAARGGVVTFKQYHARAGHYIVIDGERTGVDYAYMHMRDAALVDPGDRVRTGQLIGYVGDTGRASGCHLHLELWKAPGWYDGGSPFDPLPSLLAWDRTS